MTETEWLACDDAWVMLQFLSFRVSDRKLRLFACACCRLLWAEMPDERCRRAVVVAEEYADGQVGPQDLELAGDDLKATFSAFRADWPELFGDSRVAHPTGQDPERGAVRRGTAMTAAQAVLWLTLPFSMYNPTERPEESTVCAINDFVREALPPALISTGSQRRSVMRLISTGPQLREVMGNPFHPVSPPDPAWLLRNDRAVARLAQSIYDEGRFDDLPLLADALADTGCADEDVLSHLRSPGPHVRGCWAVDWILGKT